MKLHRASQELFFSKNDPDDPRLGELAQAIQPTELRQKYTVCLIGYPGDEGIRANGGRIGASLGPDQIRNFLYRMTPNVHNSDPIRIADLGNLDQAEPLTQIHQNGKQLISEICKSGNVFLSLGGGHDFGYSDGAGFISSFRSSEIKPLIINFDAHLDVRPLKDQPHSGTAFYRLLKDFKDQFELIEIGLQNQCNSRAHWQWAESMGATLITLEACLNSPLELLLGNIVDKNEKRPLYLSLDIDCFPSSLAPGCSQSFSHGIDLNHFLLTLQSLCHSFDVKGMGIFEVSPPLDQDHRTSKLAALISHTFLSELSRKRRA